MMESIDIADTHYGKHAAVMERALKAEVDSMSQDKKMSSDGNWMNVKWRTTQHLLAANKRK